MTQMPTRLPVLARSLGRWTGTYTHLSPDGTLIDTYRVDCSSSFPSDGTADYRLVTHNMWPDGRESGATHEADWRNGRLEWKGALTGWMSEIDDRTLYLRFGFVRDPSILVCEMIQVSLDGCSRARTWHWFRDDRLYQITLTDERRIDRR